MLAKANMQIFGDPETMAAMSQQFMRAASLGNAAEGLFKTLPPQGIFDVRFATNRYAEEIQAAFVPLLATDWEVKDNSTAWQAYVDQRKNAPLTEAEVLKEDGIPEEKKAEERKAYVAKRLAL